MMKSISVDTPVGQLVTECPARARVFERLGIDYCCGGSRSLDDACARRGLEVNAVLRALESCEREGSTEDPTDWSKRSMTDLVHHIATAHHGYLREALPNLAHLIAKVERAHGDRHPELHELQRIFSAFWGDLELHMLKEEEVLFPMCAALEGPARAPAVFCHGSVQYPIRAMVQEHEDAGKHLAEMRRVTHDFTPPHDACGSYGAMLAGLAELEADMHRHVHKENNILFPRAIAAEARRMAPAEP
jgi:regulator of cell morphogenesis and NO signaling